MWILPYFPPFFVTFVCFLAWTAPSAPRLQHNLIIYLHNNAAVWLIALDGIGAHNQQLFLIIDLKEGNSVALMVDHRQMLIIREYRNVFRILTADRQTAQHGQKTCLYVAAVDGYALISRIAAEHMLLIRREA